jgi:hypothetical protein
LLRRLTTCAALTVALLSLSMAGCRAVVHVTTPAPNAVGYLVQSPPAAGTAPATYVEKFDLPATIAVSRHGEPHWLYVTSPDHQSGQVELTELKRKGTNNVTVSLVQTGEVGGLD